MGWEASALNSITVHLVNICLESIRSGEESIIKQYRERSCLSTIKIMSQATRKTNADQSYCGHYKITGNVCVVCDLENTVIMSYGSTLGVPFLNNIMENIDIEKVESVHDDWLRMHNPPLKSQFDSSDFHHTMQRSMLCKLVNESNVESTH